MRVLPLLIALLMLASTATAAPMLQDDSGDHTYTVATAAGDKSQMPALDLLSVALEETKNSFVFTLAVDELEPQGPELRFGQTGISYYIYFDYGDVDYRVAIYRFTDTLGGEGVDFFARFQVYDAGRERFNNADALNVEADLGEDTLTVAVDRDEILSAEGATPRKGTALQGFYAESTTRASVDFLNAGLPAIYEGGDRMPNDGISSIIWEIQYGLEQAGDARLSSELPVRTSNGAATTFLFTVLAENIGDKADSYQLGAQGVPEGWEVDFPDKRIKLDASSQTEVPVLVTIPFNHKHGYYTPITVEMSSQTDPDSVGRVELGIRFTEVPQPAGHHDRLYIHRGETQTWFDVAGNEVIQDAEKYFNTLEEDEFAEAGDITRTRPICEGTSLTHRFDIPLAPSLDMGLDFDLSRVGLLEATLGSETPMTDVVLNGQLMYFLGWGEGGMGGDRSEPQFIELATIATTPLSDLSGGGSSSFEAEIVPTEEADYIPYQPGAFVMLRLEFTEMFPSAGMDFSCYANQKQPVIKPGATFTLPLDEYHDVLDAAFIASTGLELLAEDGLKRFVNPGSVVIFDIRGENLGEETVSFDLALTGTNVEWAEIVGAQTVSLESGGVISIPIAVTVPAEAKDGAIVDINLAATRTDDANVKSVIRMVAEVDTDAEYPNDAERVQAILGDQPVDKESPGLPLVALLGLLVLARKRF